MPIYRIHRMKEVPRTSFRWAAHASGAAVVKPRDYEPGGEVEAAGVYAAWAGLQSDENPLQVGDLLEDPEGRLCIFKYVGFEQASWQVVEPKPAMEGQSFPVTRGAELDFSSAPAQ